MEFGPDHIRAGPPPRAARRHIHHPEKRTPMRNRIKMGLPSRTMKVHKGELLARLLANVETHVADCKEATEGYRLEAIRAVTERGVQVNRALQALVDQLESGQTPELQVGLNLGFALKRPEDHEKDYRQIIEMVRMSAEDVITLSSEEFACYVMDDWDWKEEFAASTAGYKMSLARSRAG
jgi:hypothetical protein